MMSKIKRNTIIMVSIITTFIIITSVPMKRWDTSIQLCDSDLLDFVKYFCESHNTTVVNEVVSNKDYQFNITENCCVQKCHPQIIFEYFCLSKTFAVNITTNEFILPLMASTTLLYTATIKPSSNLYNTESPGIITYSNFWKFFEGVITNNGSNFEKKVSN